MRPVDLKSVLVAALIGGLVLSVYGAAFGEPGQNSGWWYPAAGAISGAGVQVGLRIFGVS
jgi:hypothetical protein